MGVLIALEGTDASGKATQTKLLAEHLHRVKHEAPLYSFPRYNTALGATIKRHLVGDTLVAERSHEFDPVRRAPEDPLWFQAVCLADKYEAAADIEAHLRADRFVVCDRWKPSAIAFGASDGLDVNWVERVQERLPTANLNILLLVSEEEALRRRPNLRDRYEKDRDKQKIVRLNYARIWADRSQDKTEPNVWVTIDGEGTIDDVHMRIWKHVMVVARDRGLWP